MESGQRTPALGAEDGRTCDPCIRSVRKVAYSLCIRYRNEWTIHTAGVLAIEYRLCPPRFTYIYMLGCREFNRACTDQSRVRLDHTVDDSFGLRGGVVKGRIGGGMSANE